MLAALNMDGTVGIPYRFTLYLRNVTRVIRKIGRCNDGRVLEKGNQLRRSRKENGFGMVVFVIELTHILEQLHLSLDIERKAVLRCEKHKRVHRIARIGLA